MTALVRLVLLGLGSGAIYALAALGLVVVYRSSGVVNFAQGALGMAGAYVFYSLTSESGWATVPAIAAGIVASVVLALATYAVTAVGRRHSANITRVVGTLAVLLILAAAANLKYGSEALLVRQFLHTGTVSFGGGLTIGSDRLTLLVVALALTVALSLLYRQTRFGLATSAVAESPRNLAALGWSVGVVRAANWGLGGALAGLSGILLAPITGVAPDSATLLLVPVLGAALIGGLRSFPLTLVGGLGIGALQSVLVRYNGGISGAADAVPFIAIVLVMVIRGRGLPLRSFIGERLPRVGSGRIRALPLAAGVASIALLIAVGSADWNSAVTVTLAVGLIVLSTTVVLGYAGQLSLVQLMLAGIGALIAAHLAGDLGVPFVLTIPAAVLGTVPVGILVGLPSLRTRGVSLAIATLGLALVIGSLVFGSVSLAGGNDGVSIAPTGKVSLFGWDIGTLMHAQRYAFVCLAMFVLCALAVANLRRGRAGRRLVAVRSNERAAAALGIDVAGAKLWAFAIAGGIAAFAGVLIAFQYQSVVFSQFDVFDNISVVAYSVVGGLGSPVGALVGGILAPAGVGSQLLGGTSSSLGDYIELIGGVLLLVTVVLLPDGVVPTMGRIATHATKRFTGLLPSALGVSPRRRAKGDAGTPEAIGVQPSHGSTVAPQELEVNGIHVAFGGVVAVDEVSLRVRPGEIVGVIGPNGAGKTTLIDAITGFQRCGGGVVLGGRALPAGVHRRARRGLARSFQSLELFEDLTVLDNLRCAGDPRDAASYMIDLVHPARGSLSAATLAAIRTFRLEDQLDRLPGELSFGTRRLVALARAIAGEPSVLLLDEPCAGLDKVERREVGVLIRLLAREWGMGVLLVEHDVELVRQLSDRIVVMEFGRVIDEGRPEVVLAGQRVIDAYLGRAETREDAAADLAGAVEALER